MKVPFLSFYDLFISLASSTLINNILHVSIEKVSDPMAMPGHLRLMVSSFWPFHDLYGLLRTALVEVV
jgi:hypothetical protein